MNLKCVIIDDEPLAINVIKNHVEQIKELKVIATFTNAIDSLSYVREQEIDILFLDVNMPLLDGFEFLKSLENPPLTIITSAHEEFAIKGFELEVLDYLVKPVPFPRFLKAVNKAIAFYKNKKVEKSDREHIFVKVDKKRMNKIYLDDILIVESLKDYIKITTTQCNHVVHQTLTGFTEMLPTTKFVRIHRSFTANITKITAVEGNSVELAGKRYTIGRNYLENAKNAILKKQKS